MPIMSSVGALSYAKLGNSTVPNREFYCLKFLPAGINSASSGFTALSNIAFDPTDTTGNYVYYSATMISDVNSFGDVSDNIGLIPFVGNTNFSIDNKRSFSAAPESGRRVLSSLFRDSAYNSLDNLIYNVGTLIDQPDTPGSFANTQMGVLVKTNLSGSSLFTQTQLPKLGRSVPFGGSVTRPVLSWQSVLVEPYTGFPTGRIFIGGYDTVGSFNAYGIVPQLQFVSDNGSLLSLTRWNDGAVANKVSGDAGDHTMCMARAPDGNTIVGYSNDTTTTKGAVYIRKVSSTVTGGILPTVSSIGIEMGTNDQLWLRDLAVDSAGNIYCVIKRATSGVFYYHVVMLNSSYVIQYDFYTTAFAVNSVCVTPDDRIFVAGGNTIYNLTGVNFSNGKFFAVGESIRGNTRLIADNLNNVYLTTRYLGSLPAYPFSSDFGVVLKFENLTDLVNSTFSNGTNFSVGTPSSSWVTGTLSTFALVATGTSETPNTLQSRPSLVNSNSTSRTTAWLI